MASLLPSLHSASFCRLGPTLSMGRVQVCPVQLGSAAVGDKEVVAQPNPGPPPRSPTRPSVRGGLVDLKVQLATSAEGSGVTRS